MRRLHKYSLDPDQSESSQICFIIRVNSDKLHHEYAEAKEHPVDHGCPESRQLEEAMEEFYERRDWHENEWDDPCYLTGWEYLQIRFCPGCVKYVDDIDRHEPLILFIL